MWLTIDQPTVQKYVQRKSTISKVEKQFQDLQRQKLCIHAEVQLVLQLADIISDLEYIGCSKLSCFLCWNFLKSYGTPQTKGCHSKLYSRWTIPEMQASAHVLEKLSKAITKIQNTLVRELLSPVSEPQNAVAQSSIGMTAVEGSTGNLSNFNVQIYLSEMAEANECRSWGELIQEWVGENVSTVPRHIPGTESHFTAKNLIFRVL
jgi:hypothetical protein